MISKISLVFSILLMSTPFSAQAKDISNHRIEKISSYEIANYIKSTKGQRRIIMIYASWCSYCIKKMPAMMDIERVKKGSVIAVSVDENYRKFARYINKFDDVPFRIILNKSSEHKLAKSLKQFGVVEWEGVPEIILLDENNKVIGQGNYKIDYVSKFLFSGVK